MAEQFGYLLDPHSAVAYLGLEHFRQGDPRHPGVLLATAHPAKFIEVMETVVPGRIEVPRRLTNVLQKEKQAWKIPATFPALRETLQTLN